MFNIKIFSDFSSFLIYYKLIPFFSIITKPEINLENYFI